MTRISPRLASLCKVLPARRLSRANLKYLEQAVPAARRKLYVDEAPSAPARTTAEDALEVLSVECGRRAIQEAGLGTADIDYFITCETGATGQPIATLIQRELGVSPLVQALALQNGACGMIDALGLAADLVAAGQCQQVLVVAPAIWDIRGEGLLDPTDPSYAMFGDAVAAAVVSDTGNMAKLLAYRSATDGTPYEMMGARLRDRRDCTLSPFAPVGSAQVMHGAYVDIGDDALDWMEGSAAGLLTRVVAGALSDADAAGESVDWVAWQPFGSAGSTWLTALRAAMPWARPADRFSELGWTGAAGPMLSLDRIRQSAAAGARIMIAGIGEGGQAAALLIEAGPGFPVGPASAV